MHIASLKMHRMHAHCKFQKNGFAHAHRNSQLAIAHHKSCLVIISVGAWHFKKYIRGYLTNKSRCNQMIPFSILIPKSDFNIIVFNWTNSKVLTLHLKIRDCEIWQCRLWSFQGRGTKLESFKGAKCDEKKSFPRCKSFKGQSDLRSKGFQGTKGVEKLRVLRSKLLWRAKCSEEPRVPGRTKCWGARFNEE